MPSAKRARPILGRRAPAPVVIHSAPLVLPMTAGPLRDGAVATRGERVLAVGPRAELLASCPAAEETRWPGMIVAGLVDACSTGPSAAPGVTARARVVSDLAEPAGLPGVWYVAVTSESEERWEEHERDALITAIREIDRPCAIGLAVRTRHPLVLEDVAVLARTFGLRLLVDLSRHSPAALDEAGVLGPLCHVVCARPLDPGERKLLRLRRTAVALCPAPAVDALTLLEEGNTVAFSDTGSAGPLGMAAAVRRLARERGLRRRGLDRRLVEAATLGGATALGMDRGKGRIGALAPGARADFAVYDARGRYPYSVLLAEPPCVGTVVGGTVGGPLSRVS
ncbi:hypothetical protein FAF44_40080 [Nonomuraea sp. MG754425]|uniref:amidohydrolase family protein n=1 Tax=Nonomuraea sp. MG754425 TaxID=2570319 RepID=UPI001F17D0A2|nr:amidohydrolase family protein [Nonomuraea sp. MG754425]MCF6474538.1 hypothetical protein [Nonomuraea sp. MG754425]